METFLNNYKAKMRSFFFQKSKLMLQWKQMTGNRLKQLYLNLESHARKHCDELYLSRKGRAEADAKKETLSIIILQKVQQLVGSLEKGKMSAEEITEIFEQSWSVWIDDIPKSLSEDPDYIRRNVEMSMNEYHQKNWTKFLTEQDEQSAHLTGDEQFALEVMDCHIKVVCPPNTNATTEQHAEYIRKAQNVTDETFVAVSRFLSMKRYSGENFNPLLATELLRNIPRQNEIDYQNVTIFFQEFYHMRIVQIVCSYAVKVFEEMARSFKSKHDPLEYVNTKMKPSFKKLFTDHYNDVKKEKIAAETLCQQLELPVKECVLNRVDSRIGDEMREMFPWIKTKPTLIAKILFEVGQMVQVKQKDAFDYCKEFLTNAKGSLQEWLYYFTKLHCNSGAPTRIFIILEEEVNATVTALREKAKNVIMSPESTLSIDMWLKRFQSELVKTVNLQLADLCVIGGGNQKFLDCNFFMSEVDKGLQLLCEKIIGTYADLTYCKELFTSHKKLFSEVSGCTVQCPFCKAQCEDNNENHWKGIYR